MKLCEIHKNALELRNINKGLPLPVVDTVVNFENCDYCKEEQK